MNGYHNTILISVDKIETFRCFFLSLLPLILSYRLQVIAWIRGDGEDTLNKFTEIPVECEAVIKDHEQEFEKFYFISIVSHFRFFQLFQSQNLCAAASYALQPPSLPHSKVNCGVQSLDLC